jgi:hypothetical protein
MNLYMPLYIVLLFVLLTPGVLLYLPPKASLLTAAIVHGIVFAVVFHCTHRMVSRLGREGFEPDDAEDAKKKLVAAMGL